MKNRIINALHGKEKLWFACWITGIVFGYGLFMGVLGMTMRGNGLIALLNLLYYPLLLTACIALWRCAFNVEWSGWGHLARIWVLIWLFSTIVLNVPLFAFLGLKQGGARPLTPTFATVEPSVQKRFNEIKSQLESSQEKPSDSFDRQSQPASDCKSYQDERNDYIYNMRMRGSLDSPSAKDHIQSIDRKIADCLNKQINSTGGN